MCISLSANEVGPQMQTLCPYYQQGGPPRRAGQYRLEPQLAYTPPEITQGADTHMRSGGASVQRLTCPCLSCTCLDVWLQLAPPASATARMPSRSPVLCMRPSRYFHMPALHECSLIHIQSHMPMPPIRTSHPWCLCGQMPHLVGIADVAKPLIELPDHATTQEQASAPHSTTCHPMATVG